MEKPKTGPRPDPRLNYDVKIIPKPGPGEVKKCGACRARAEMQGTPEVVRHYFSTQLELPHSCAFTEKQLLVHHPIRIKHSTGIISKKTKIVLLFNSDYRKTRDSARLLSIATFPKIFLAAVLLPIRSERVIWGGDVCFT